ncbi:MAG: hypothetical protein ACRDOO_27225, partial [Actinomadura sp.]
MNARSRRSCASSRPQATDRLRGELERARLALRGEQVRIAELTRDRELARAEAAAQRERAVAAELRVQQAAGDRPAPG